MAWDSTNGWEGTPENADSGGGGSSDQYFSFADGTEIGSSGKVADGASNAIETTLSDPTTAVVASNGLSGMHTGVYWDLGSELKGSFQVFMEWVSKQDQVHHCLCVFRSSSAPTSLQDIEDAGCHFLQARVHSGGNVSTFTKEGTAALATAVNENQSGSEHISYQVLLDNNQLGAHQSLHEHGASSTDRTDGTNTTATSGNWYFAYLTGAAANVSGADKVSSVTLRGGMPA